MSEYQYYEFRAIDRPLTKEEMAELRVLSTRATITPTQFVNVYSYGDFQGDPEALMERYFDAFLYIANWGTREFMLRLPLTLLDQDAASRYHVDDCMSVRPTGDHVVVDCLSNEEEPEWVTGAEDWLPALLPLRDEIAEGDLRALYLGWLTAVQLGYLEDADREPPVPPGLGSLSPALRTFVEFHRIDEDLVTVAAERSGRLQESRSSSADVERWLHDLPESEKTALLLRVMEDNAPHLRAELLRRFREETAASRRPAPAAAAGSRTVAELLSVAEDRAKIRHREETKRAAEERARREQEEAALRAAYLDTLVGHEEELWAQVETLIETKRPTDYDQAVQLVKDLHDLSARSTAASNTVEARLRELRLRHAKKPSLMERFDRAGLPRA